MKVSLIENANWANKKNIIIYFGWNWKISFKEKEFCSGSSGSPKRIKFKIVYNYKFFSVKKIEYC